MRERFPEAPSGRSGGACSSCRTGWTMRKWISQGSILLLLSCATVEMPEDGEDDDEQWMNDGSGGDMMMATGGGFVVIGNGGTIVIGSGGEDNMVTGGTSSGGGLVGDDTGGSTSAGGAATGGATASGGASSGGSTSSGGSSSSGGSTSSGGTTGTPGSPAQCLLNWQSTSEAATCSSAPNPAGVQGCMNALNCWQTNDCSPSQCSGGPDDTCGQNKVANYTQGSGQAIAIFNALCN